jgi:hypothetical protein
MMIAAKSFNLGSCDTGFGACVKGNTKVGKALELKENEQIYGSILLGYPKSTPGVAVNEALEKICPIKKEQVTKCI